MIRDVILPNDKTVRLDRNDCLVPSIIREVLNKTKIIPEDLFIYSSCYSLLSALRVRLNLTRDRVYINSGSESILRDLIFTLDCKAWAIPTPTFELFHVYCSLYKKRVFIENFQYSDNFIINLKHGHKEHGLYIVSPHNPTGYIFTEEDIQRYSRTYKYVIIDQAYIDPLLRIPAFPKNVIIVRTFSKLGGLTGMRVGFCVGSREIINKLQQLRPMFMNAIALKLAETIALGDYTERIIKSFNRCTAYLSEIYQEKLVLSCGNFALLKDVSSFKNRPLKKYLIDETTFYRITLFDKEIEEIL